MIDLVVIGKIFCMTYMFLGCNAFSIQDDYAWRNDCLGGMWTYKF